MFKSINVFLFFVFFLIFSASAQEKSRENIYEVLSEKQQAEWYNVRRTWEEKYFYLFLKKQKIKFSCAHCVSIYIDIEVEVMEDGHSHIKILTTKKCGSEFSAKQIMELEKLFLNMQFSSEMMLKKFVARVGNGLKC